MAKQAHCNTMMAFRARHRCRSEGPLVPSRWGPWERPPRGGHFGDCTAGGPDARDARRGTPGTPRQGLQGRKGTHKGHQGHQGVSCGPPRCNSEHFGMPTFKNRAFPPATLLRNLGTDKKRSRSEKAILGATLGIPGYSWSSSRNGTHDLIYVKTLFSEQLSKRLSELVGRPNFSPNSRSVFSKLG